jgi:nicotinamide N-methyltransferase
MAPSAARDDPEVEDEGEALGLFVEPADYYPPSPTPTTQTHALRSGESLTLRLVSHNPLWGHYLWNAGRLVSTYLEDHASLITGRTVLELGAGAGLPSLVCGVLGARRVVVSDYPDPDLVSNLWHNIETGPGKIAGRVVAEGYRWGADVAPLLVHLDSSCKERFDVLILADLLFNHSEHAKLVATIRETLAKTRESVALVFFTPYRPWLYEKDMAFFDLVREAGFIVEKILEEKMAEVMFKEDRGDEELRRTVFGYTVRWPM